MNPPTVRLRMTHTHIWREAGLPEKTNYIEILRETGWWQIVWHYKRLRAYGVPARDARESLLYAAWAVGMEGLIFHGGSTPDHPIGFGFFGDKELNRRRQETAA